MTISTEEKAGKLARYFDALTVQIATEVLVSGRYLELTNKRSRRKRPYKQRLYKTLYRAMVTARADVSYTRRVITELALEVTL